MNEITILPMQVEDFIQKFIKQKFKEDHLSDAFPNPLLREDVLDLLDKYCTVVYYPLENEENNGFRIKEVPFTDGSRHDFVFINTAQTMEKQAFTAAHELGHIWNVDSYVISECGLEETAKMQEAIINRFAAVLLIPKENFKASVRAGLKEYVNTDTNTITYLNLIKLIVDLMSHFFAPLKAIIYRFDELRIFREQNIVQTLLRNDKIPEKAVTEVVKGFIIESGHAELLNPSNKKWIEGLAEKLDIAEKNNLISKRKIELMRERFNLGTSVPASPEMNDLISLDTQEGFETSCKLMHEQP